MTLSQIIDLVIDPELSEASQWLRSKESACQYRRRGFDSDQACSAELTSVVRENTGTPQSPFILSFAAPWGLEVGGVLLRGARSPAGWLQRPQPQGATHVSLGGGDPGPGGLSCCPEPAAFGAHAPAVHLCVACVCRSHRKCCNPVIHVLSRPGV